MSLVDRTLNQRRAARLYEAKHTHPSLLRPIDTNSPTRLAPSKVARPKGFAPVANVSTGNSPTATGGSAPHSHTSSSSGFSNGLSFGTPSLSPASNAAPATLDDPDVDKVYFPLDVKAKNVLPVMPRNVTHVFALTAVKQWLDNFRGTVRQVSSYFFTSYFMPDPYTAECQQCPLQALFDATYATRTRAHSLSRSYAQTVPGQVQ
jgi:hypothetical protein